MIDLEMNETKLARTIQRARERNVIIPTFEQLRNPELIPQEIKAKLKDIGLWDIKSYNLFRTTWKNEPKVKGGLFSQVNYVEFPPELTGVEARIIALVGKWFPTSSHKVGATFGCLVPQLVTGQFDPTIHQAVWPSTGNFCRGGAYNSTLLACKSIAVLPEDMSQERFDWLSNVAGEVITTPGGESNIKEVFDKCWELKETRIGIVVFNQFENFGNYLWHYEVTGPAMEEVLKEVMTHEHQFAGMVASSGSAGTLSGAGDYLKEKFPSCNIAAAEPLQCPTLLLNGFGDHRIEGIGDKHVPWIHNVRNTDMVIAVDDEYCINLLRLFNELDGKKYLSKQGVPKETLDNLDLIGISGISNLIAAIKFSKYYELTDKDVVLTVLTDSMDLYKSHLQTLRIVYSGYTELDAIKNYYSNLVALTTDNMKELNYYDRKRIHNLKYFTWIEQQEKDIKELYAQWYHYPGYWKKIQAQAEEIDKLIEEFNKRTGLLNII